MDRCRTSLVWICFLLLSAGSLSAQRSGAKWNTYEDLPVYDANAGNFIEWNWRGLAEQALQAYQQKKYEKAARIYLYMLSFDYHDCQAIYNLACCYARLQKPALAVLYLRRALNAGFNKWPDLLKDDDLVMLRGYADFDSLYAAAQRLHDNSGEEIYIEGKKLFKCRVRFLVANGRYDTAVDDQQAVQAQTFLAKKGFDVSLHQYAGGHELPAQLFAHVFEWMASAGD
ncbi:hypothetical protein JXO59_12490 [candidate division KSB1 bacterium]|nr:hypothetical protein [candidate division KSB1 bacterium]